MTTGPLAYAVRSTVAAIAIALLAACAPDSAPTTRTDPGVKPTRFTIVPDDYHVPYAGTAEDGRRFFLSDELFTYRDGRATAYVGLFLWHPDGTFDEAVATPVAAERSAQPPGQAASVASPLVDEHLASLGDYVLEPITVEPFTTRAHGTTFGWKVRKYDGDYAITIAPGDFIAYYAPWDGLDYDT